VEKNDVSFDFDLFQLNLPSIKKIIKAYLILCVIGNIWKILYLVVLVDKSREGLSIDYNFCKKVYEKDLECFLDIQNFLLLYL
jgi:hypothetical protein